MASGASAAIRGPGGASASIRRPGVRADGSNQFSRAHQQQFAPELYQRVLEQTVLTNLVGKNDTGGKGRTIGRSFGEALSRASLSRTGAASAIAEAASADGVSIGRGSMYTVVVSVIIAETYAAKKAEFGVQVLERTVLTNLVGRISINSLRSCISG